DVYSLYDNIVNLFQNSGSGDQVTAMNIISNFVNNFGVTGSARGLVSNIGKYTFGSDDFKRACIDVFSYFNSVNWQAFADGSLITSDSWNALLAATGQTAETWVSYLKETLGSDYMTQIGNMDINNLGTMLGISNLGETVTLTDLSGSIYWNTFALSDGLKTVFSPQSAASIADILNINKFLGGMSILDTPSSKLMPGVFIPILAAGTQIIQSLITTAKQNNDSKKKQEDNPMAQSMKSMIYVMPFVSGFICLSLPVGVGLYWIMGTVVQIVQQLLINLYIDRKPVEEIIQKSVEKSEKRLEKYGVKTQGDGTVSYLARTSTKSLSDYSRIKSEASEASDTSDNAGNGASSGSGSGKSISDIANIMKNRNK
ncbi:MAG: YidC/Oxa1 family membrane protein insertase, partial [Lachnospiraceae bacterium]|nr:YidC/Oxa1 family membrane protein insertase [Lachnospiraceae bacterium]